MASPDSVGAVIVAAGSGSRFGPAETPKQYLDLGGAPLLLWALQPFLTHPGIRHVVVVLPAADVADPPDWLRGLAVTRVPGGAERGISVRNGLRALGDSVGRVLVHDGARPLVSRRLIDRVLEASETSGVIPGVPVVDTVKEVDSDRRVVGTLDRSRLWRVQTPQAFPLALLRECHERAAEEGIVLTDDAALLERYGYPVHVVEGDPENLKVTTPIDLDLCTLLARGLPDARKPTIDAHTSEVPAPDRDHV